MQALLHYRGYIVVALTSALVIGLGLTVVRWPRPEMIEITNPGPEEATGVPETITRAPAPAEATPEPMRVHVAGAVRLPGVYGLPAGSRVIDAVEAAGGLEGRADADRVNLADRVNDGQQVYIPFVATPPPPSPTPLTAPVQADSPNGSGESLVNINTASAAELESLPGIGPVLAQRIIEYRVTNGPFGSMADIEKVRGIGPASYEQIRSLICVQ